MNQYGGEGPSAIDDPDGFDDESMCGADEYGYMRHPECEDDISTEVPPSDDDGVTTNDNTDLDEFVVPPWDAGLNDGQTSTWANAEKFLGTCRSVGGWLKGHQQEAQSTVAT